MINKQFTTEAQRLHRGPQSREIPPGPLGVWLERAIVAALVLLVIAAPNSIAATQTAWLLGMLFWVLRFAVWPRPEVHRTPIDYAMLGFFILTGISAVLSYEPMVSVGKLRAASLFTIVYLFAQNIRSARVLRALAILLVASCMVSVIYTFGQYAVGRGVKVYEVRSDSPLSAARLVSREHIQAIPILSGDTLLEVDGRKLRGTEDLIEALDQSSKKEPAKIKIYRVEWIAVLEVPRGRLLPGATPEERLGIRRWTPGRDWRATGFYDHWTTYAEGLQLIASLTLGLFVALPRKRTRNGALLALAIVSMCAALLLTVTRASWLALLISATLIAVLGLSRRSLLLIAVCALPLVVAGVFVLHQKRNVGFFDQADDSIRWRQTVQREGFQLLVSNPRHLLVGVGMDSIKAHWRQWGLFDNGRLPMGHMHSDYLQIALERGVPTLIVWLILLGTYARMLWRLRRRVPIENWIERGIVFGALGGLIGFMLSGIVHYNWGDSEVVMIFYLIMGLSLVVARRTSEHAYGAS
ncbi:MAG TPA: O-antigen ligase family protein [Pyrinomonadaceae bacterium]|nr:O-antigen ligase family protein [Pyrinomonadaceae bacterium]